MQLLQDLAHLVGHPDRVGPRFLVHKKSDRRLAVEAGHRFPVRFAFIDPGHVPQSDDPAPLGTCQNHIPELLDALEFAEGPEAVPEAAASNAPSRSTVVGEIESVRDLGNRHIVQGQTARIHLDLDLSDRSARDRGHGDAVQLLQPTLEHRVGQVPQLGKVRPGDRQRNDGIVGRIGRENDRALGALRQRTDKIVQPLPDVEHRELHVRSPVELQTHQRLTFARPGIDGADRRNAAHYGLDRLGDKPLYLRRPRIRVGRPDRERRKGNVGQEVDRQARERDRSQHTHREVQHGRRDGTPDRQVGQRHQLTPPPRSPPTLSSRFAHPIK